MIIPIFTLKLNNKIYPRLVTLGKYDGVHPCLTAATTAGKVFVHDPHGRQARGSRTTSASADSDVYLLNINQQVTALCAGNLLPEASSRDALFVGSQTNLLAYDVDRNCDLFYRETPDGVNALAVGNVAGIDRPIVVAGGNCSLLGFNSEGDEMYWTVTGDNVASLTLADFDNDGGLELIVGSDDYNIRVFKEADMISEMDETDSVTSLCAIDPTGSRFGYGLANGTVGVYDRTARYWRIKSKNQAVALHAFDIDADGVPELIIGWSNGKVDARNSRSSEVVFKDTFPAVIAGLVHGDYRMDGKEELIICAADGEVRGFLPALHSGNRTQLGSAAAAAAMEATGSGPATLEQEKMWELQEKRQQLLLELRNYETNLAAGKTANTAQLIGPVVDAGGQVLGVIPANTQLRTGLTVVTGDEQIPPNVQLSIVTSNEMIVRAVMVFAEGIFPEGESFVAHPPNADLDPQIHIPIMPPKDEPVDLHIKALVGHRSSTQFHVFELARQLPRFSLYLLAPPDLTAPEPESSVTFQMNERVNRVLMWINQSFLLLDPLQADGGKLDVAFVSLRDNRLLRFRMHGNQMSLCTDNMDLAGDILQAMAAFLGIVDLQVDADFPKEMERLREVLLNVDEYHASRQKLSAEMADHSNLIRSLVVRAEDARLLGDSSGMMKGYAQLYDLNRDLITGYKLRCTNHLELLTQLRCVNQYIQRAGRLRVGKYKTQVIGACRSAIKNNNVEGLFKIIKVGSLS